VSFVASFFGTQCRVTVDGGPPTKTVWLFGEPYSVAKFREDFCCFESEIITTKFSQDWLENVRVYPRPLLRVPIILLAHIL